VGPRDGLKGCRIAPPPGFEPWTVQPVASHYTDASHPAPQVWYSLAQFGTVWYSTEPNVQTVQNKQQLHLFLNESRK